jgi:hypothetical protein
VALCLAKSSSTPVTKIEDVFSIGKQQILYKISPPYQKHFGGPKIFFSEIDRRLGVLASIEVIDVPNKQPSEVILTGTHRITISNSVTPKQIFGETQSYFRVAVREFKVTLSYVTSNSIRINLLIKKT